MKEMSYPTLDLKATGERIGALRKQRGITVKELAEFMGFHEPKAVYKWQKGECLPTVDNLYALSRYLGVAIEEILVGSDEDSLCPENLRFSGALSLIYSIIKQAA